MIIVIYVKIAAKMAQIRSRERLRCIMKNQGLPPRQTLMTLDKLETFQDELDELLTTGMITPEQYEREWNELLGSVGWSREKYEQEVDRRWDYIEKTNVFPPYGHGYGPN